MKIGDKVIYKYSGIKFSLPKNGDIGYIKNFSKDNECCLVKFDNYESPKNVWVMKYNVEVIE